MKRLIVYFNSIPVGILAQDDNGLLRFQYGSPWLENPEAIPLSRSLPLRKEPFKGRHARPFFAGILPDEGPRQQIAAILGVSERNDFAMLERIGGECTERSACCRKACRIRFPARGERGNSTRKNSRRSSASFHAAR